MLLKGRDGYHRYSPIKNSNNKVTKGKRLLKLQSNISLTSLEKHLPTLLDLDLCHFDKDGGFFMVGSKKINQQFKSYKKIPITVGKNLRETKGNVNAVLIIANLYRQTSQIDKKITLNKAYKQEKKGLPLNSRQAYLLKKARQNKNINLDSLNKVENLVLSNKGISNLITGLLRDSNKNSVSHGGYWRKVLEKRGFILSRRRYKTIWSEKISYQRFLEMRSYFKSIHGFVTYKNGRVVKPIVSEVLSPNVDYINTTLYNTSILNSIYSRKLGVEGHTSC